MSPDVGALDRDAVIELFAVEPDEALSLLAAMTAATDAALREQARALAGRLVVDVAARTGRQQRNRVGRIATVRWRPDGGDLDVDASLDTIVAARAASEAVPSDELRLRGWVRPATALCLLVDRSGSMTGRPLATAAVAAAAVAWRRPDDYSVVAFARDAVAVKAQSVARPSGDVVTDVLALRGHGTTDLAGALAAAGRQLDRSNAGRQVAVLLSDCRATEPGDAVAAANRLDELVVVAPAGDDAEARAFAARTGARLATVAGPSEIPEALARLLA